VTELDSLFSDDWGPEHRSGYIAVIGRPNVGKSTLINALLGQKIAITAAKPQTTRQRQLGILTLDNAQLLFIDTPGIHEPHSPLGGFMLSAAHAALRDADVILWIVDAAQMPSAEDRHIADLLARIAPDLPLLLTLNKADLLPPKPDLSAHEALSARQNTIAIVQTSAIQGSGVAQLPRLLAAQLPHGPRLYPSEQLSEANMRFLAAEAVREQIIELTSDEIPYSVAVEVTRYREKPRMSLIAATIYVERSSQKGIVIGKRGSMIKAIGSAARAALETELKQQVHLDLRVKVLRNWRSNDEFLRRLGYAPSKRKG